MDKTVSKSFSIDVFGIEWLLTREFAEKKVGVPLFVDTSLLALLQTPVFATFVDTLV